MEELMSSNRESARERLESHNLFGGHTPSELRIFTRPQLAKVPSPHNSTTLGPIL